MSEAESAVAAELRRLETYAEELLRTCDRLREENRSLRAQHKALIAERSALIERNEQARTRVESMIAHLRAMEQTP